MNPDELVTSNMGLVYHVAHQFENTGIEIGDLAQIGMVGLIKAARTFKSEKQIKFATYATRCITNEILMYLRKNNKHRRQTSLDAPFIGEDGKEIHLSDILGSDPDEVSRMIERQVERDLLQVAIEKLDFRSRKIIELRYGLGGQEVLRQRDVAKWLGVSQSYVARIEKRILVKIKKIIRRLEAV